MIRLRQKFPDLIIKFTTMKSILFLIHVAVLNNQAFIGKRLKDNNVNDYNKVNSTRQGRSYENIIRRSIPQYCYSIT